MKLVALQNKIILKQTEAETKIGNIHIPDTAKKKVFSGVVVAVGPGKPMSAWESLGGGRWREGLELLKPGVEVGDFIHYADYHGGQIEHEGQTYLVIDEDDVLAVVRK